MKDAYAVVLRPVVTEKSHRLMEDAGERRRRGGPPTRLYTFEDFRTALVFTNQVGHLAEAEGHHPDITVSYGKVEINLWTHAVDGLTRNDFILAAKISELRRPKRIV